MTELTERLAILETKMAQVVATQSSIANDIKDVKRFQSKTSAIVTVIIFLAAGLVGWIKLGMDVFK